MSVISQPKQISPATLSIVPKPENKIFFDTVTGLAKDYILGNGNITAATEKIVDEVEWTLMNYLSGINNKVSSLSWKARSAMKHAMNKYIEMQAAVDYVMDSDIVKFARALSRPPRSSRAMQSR